MVDQVVQWRSKKKSNSGYILNIDPISFARELEMENERKETANYNNGFKSLPIELAPLPSFLWSNNLSKMHSTS